MPVQSSLAHARIKRIDTSRALALPGVLDWIAAEVRGKLCRKFSPLKNVAT